jgi:ribosomal protein S27AE
VTDYNDVLTAERSCPICGSQMLLAAITPIFFKGGETDSVAKFSCGKCRVETDKVMGRRNNRS